MTDELVNFTFGTEIRAPDSNVYISVRAKSNAFSVPVIPPVKL